PPRRGLPDALEAMGATLDVRRGDDDGEPVAEVTVSPSRLRGTTIAGALLPRAIDEIPVLAVAAACAEGPTEVRDAAELRVKESDGIHALAVEPGNSGVAVRAR